MEPFNMAAEQEMWDEIVANDPGPSAPAEDGYVWAAHALPNLGADECDRCGGRRELFHNEATGMSLCEDCDRITVEVEQALTPAPTTTGTVRFKKLRNGAWGVTGPSGLLVADAEIAVTKKSGATTVVTVGRVIWSGDGKAIATVRR